MPEHYVRFQTPPPEAPPEIDWSQGDEHDDEDPADRDGEHFDGPIDDDIDSDENWGADEPPDYPAR